MLISTKTFSDWGEFYLSNDVAESEPVDANFGVVFEVCSTNSSPVERLTKLSGFSTAAIMILVRKEGENKPSLEVIHHIQKGAPPSAPPSDSDKWYGFLGLGKDAPIVEIPSAVIKGSNEAQVPSPSISDIFSIQDAGDFARLGADTTETDPATYLRTPTVPITPMCIAAIHMVKDKKDLAAIFGRLLERISEIVSEKVENPVDEASVAAIQKICSRPLQFLWGGTGDTPLSSIFSGDILTLASDASVVARYERLRLGSLGKTDLVDDFNGLRIQGLERLARNQDNLNAAFAGRGSMLTESKNFSHFDRLHKTTQNLILNASTPFYDVGDSVPITPTKPNQELMTLFDGPKLQSKSNLEYALIAKRNANMEIDQNLASCVYQGTFLAFQQGTPHRTSVFYCHDVDNRGEMPSTVEEHWDLLLESRNVTKSDIVNHHSSKIRVAKDYLHLTAQIKNYLALLAFLSAASRISTWPPMLGYSQFRTTQARSTRFAMEISRTLS
jgi:hypothetical protein